MIRGRLQRLASHLSHHRRHPSCCFSSVDAASPADADADRICAATRRAPQRPLFPWRHETIQNLLPRLTAGTPEFAQDLAMPFPVQNALAFLFLDKGLLEVNRRAWRDELADAAGSAFTHGVAAILSQQYSIPVTPSSDDSALSFSFPKEETNNQSDKEKSKEESSAAASQDDMTDETTTESVAKESPQPAKQEEHSSVSIPDIEKMVSRPLLDLYQSARTSGKDQLLVRLQTKPTVAVLYNVFCIPFLTREHAERDPEFVKATLADLEALKHSRGAREAFLRGYERVQMVLEASGKGNRPETTVEIQVLIQCEESFQVLDATTGAVLQGSPDGAIRSVFHLVRFENTVKQRSSGRFYDLFLKTELGNWIMTDIDDLLGSKTWYQGEPVKGGR